MLSVTLRMLGGFDDFSLFILIKITEALGLNRYKLEDLGREEKRLEARESKRKEAEDEKAKILEDQRAHEEAVSGITFTRRAPYHFDLSLIHI